LKLLPPQESFRLSTNERNWSPATTYSNHIIPLCDSSFMANTASAYVSCILSIA
jgi:hypothetical protein